MNKIFRWYYQNKNKFWVIVLIIVGGYTLILWLNNYSANNQTYTNTIQNYENPDTIESEYSVLSGTYVDEKNIATANKVIDKFISYCNDKNIEGAYSLISEDCKNDMFPTIQDFVNNYYNKIFKTSKIYEMQNWKNRTYRIKFYDNPMETRSRGKWRIYRRLFYNCRKKW